MSVIQESNNAYAAVTQVDGAVSETEQRRLEQQAEVYSRLAGWTLDALGLRPGHRVLEVGCGGGSLLAAAAARVGPTGRVVGIDGDPRLVEAAKRRVAHLPWVDVVQADALGYEADESFDAVHCRRVLMHQHAPDVFLAHMVALTRPGGRIAVQEYDLEGLPCFPAFGSFERMMDAGLRAINYVGSDLSAGRKLLDRFTRAELSDLRLEAQTPFVPFVDERMEVVLDAFAVFGGVAERAGAMSVIEYEGLVDEVRAAHHDPLYANYLVRFPSMVAAVGTRACA